MKTTSFTVCGQLLLCLVTGRLLCLEADKEAKIAKTAISLTARSSQLNQLVEHRLAYHFVAATQRMR